MDPYDKQYPANTAECAIAAYADIVRRGKTADKLLAIDTSHIVGICRTSGGAWRLTFDESKPYSINPTAHITKFEVRLKGFRIGTEHSIQKNNAIRRLPLYDRVGHDRRISRKVLVIYDESSKEWQIYLAGQTRPALTSNDKEWIIEQANKINSDFGEDK